MKRKWIVTAGLVIILAYALLPVIAGAFQIGELDGPAIYPKEYHALMFRIGYSLAGHGKPRGAYDGTLWHRPLFYGVHPMLISEDEATQFFTFLQTNNVPGIADRMKARYEELKKRIAESSPADDAGEVGSRRNK